MKEDIMVKMNVPQGVQAKLQDNHLSIRGPQGEVQRIFDFPGIKLGFQGTELTISAIRATRKEKATVHAIESHIKNMFAGCQEPHEYVLKLCSVHFPMKATLTAGEVTVKNFLGEALPRSIKVPAGLNVTIEGDLIKVRGADIEKTGQFAASLEKLAVVRHKDRRVFQDGIYIISKCGVRLV